MKKNIFLILLLSVCTFSFSQIKSDKITPPKKGKAVIYFMRTSGLGALMNIRYFHKNEYLGKFNGVNYLRYECNPGKNTFWIKAENVDVLEADLAPNKIYIIETNASLGAFSAGAKFKIVDFSKKSQIKRINRLFKKKDPKTFTKKELKEAKEKMMKVIKKSLKKVESKIKKGKVKKLSSNMNFK